MRSSGLRNALALLLVLASAPVARAAHPLVAVVKSNAIGPFEEAAGAFTTALRRSPTQPEVLSLDLEGEQRNATATLLALHERRPALIVAVGSLATSVVLGDAWDVPVLFSMVLYPGQSGFVSHGGRPVSGASLDVAPARQFDVLRRLLPRARRIGVLYHPAETGSIVEGASAVAAERGFTLVAKQVDDPAGALAALGELMEGVDAVWTVADSHVFTPQTTAPLILAALRRGVPMLGLSPVHVRTGALAALSCDYADVGSQTAELAERVLRGENPATIPFATPRKVTIALNLRTAQHLGLSVPADLEHDAGEVIR